MSIPGASSNDDRGELRGSGGRSVQGVEAALGMGKPFNCRLRRLLRGGLKGSIGTNRLAPESKASYRAVNQTRVGVSYSVPSSFMDARRPADRAAPSGLAQAVETEPGSPNQAPECPETGRL